MDNLKNHLESERNQGLRRIAEVCGKSREEICQLRSHVHQCCFKHQQQFLKYCEMDKPTTWSERCKRNNEREELRQVGETVLTSMQQVFDASLKPMTALHGAQAELLQKIDTTIDMLKSLRAETVASFGEYAAKLEVDQWATETAVTSLAPSIENVDKFMQCFSLEVHMEKDEAESLNQELLEKLQKEEATFLDANDSPSWNPLFAKTQDELAALRQRVDERARSHASHVALMQSWDSFLKAMASKQHVETAETPEPNPSKRSFWRHLKCSTRAPPTFT